MFLNEEEFRREILKELNTISIKNIFTRTNAFSIYFKYIDCNGLEKVFIKNFSVAGNSFTARKPHYSNARINIGKYNTFLPEDFVRSFLYANSFAVSANIWCPHALSSAVKILDNKPRCSCYIEKSIIILKPVFNEIKVILNERINNQLSIDLLQSKMNEHLSRKLDIQLDNLIKYGYENIDPDVCAERLEEIAKILRKSKKLEFLE